VIEADMAADAALAGLVAALAAVGVTTG